MAVNRGKAFEQQFKKNWLKCFPNSFIYRLPDQVSGFHGSKNVSDFICYADNHLYLLDTKSTQGASIPITNLSQLDMMYSYRSVENCLCGFIVWFIDKCVVAFIPAELTYKYRKEGKKSIRFDDENIFVLPGIKKKVFINTDYTKLNEVWDDTT